MESKTNKRETKAEFIKRMTALSQSICKKNDIVCKGERSVVSIGCTYPEIREFIRFYAFDKNERRGYIDIMSDKGEYQIEIGGKVISKGKI